MRVAVVGLGKIGLPLAVQYATAGCRVTGVDIDPHVVAIVGRGLEPFPGERHLADRLAAAVGCGALQATTDGESAVADADVVVIVVPLIVGLDCRPDFSALDAATRTVAAGLRPGTLICYETTLPVGTTRGRWRPLISSISGLGENDDVHLVFSPERVLTGRTFRDLARYPKLVGGLTTRGSELARRFYERVLNFDDRPDLHRPNGVWDLGSAEAAELAKLAETTYRDVNIGLANQFAMYADSLGVDIRAVIEATNSQPYSHIHQPGIAVGGHCIPVYPHLYLAGDPSASIVAAARRVNAGMPAYAVDLVVSAFGELEGANVVVLGAAYRGGVRETAFSGVFPLVDELRARGAKVQVHDPLYTDDELRRFGFDPFHLGTVADIAFVQADHVEYRRYGDAELPGVSVIVDGRRVIDPQRVPEATVLTIGGGRAHHSMMVSRP
jgi:UDP-N-acetyl-D-glucosamine dehydrogenase